MGKSEGTTKLTVKERIGRIALVASRWNEPITRKLVEGARTALTRAGIEERDTDTHWIPGSFELPQAVETLAKTGRYVAIVPIGCLIRGETIHFDVIARAVATGLDTVGRSCDVAVSFGVLTVNSYDQALSRAGGQFGNKGEEAAMAALEMALFEREFRGDG